MYAHVEERNGSKYLVFDVFFNNDGRSMLKHSNQQQYVWQIPYQIADLNNGGYKGDTLSNLSIDFYDKNASSAYNAVLSRDFSNFYKNNANSAKLNPLQTDHSFGQSIYLYTLGVRAGRSRNKDLSDTFHSNKDDQTIKNATKLSAPYSSYSYGIGVRTTAVNEAAHLHCDVKLRPGVTTEDIQNAYTWANTSSYGRTTNSAYTFISGREPYGEENLPRKKSDSEAPKLYLNGQPMTDGKEFTTYQGESTPLKFEASDNEGKLKNFKVTGMPSGDFSVDNQSATETAKYSKDYSQEKFENKVNGQPKEKIYDIAVTATDEAGNTTSHSVKVQLKNQSSKYAAPTADVITVKRGEKPSNDGILAKLKYNKEDDKKGTPSVVSIPDTNLAPDAFKTGDTADAGAAVVKVTYSDGSYHTVNVPVKVKKPDNLANTLTGHTVEVKVGDPLKQTADKKVDAKQYVTTTGNVQPQKVEFENEPRTDLAGTFKRKAIATYPDGSKNETDVTFKVKPLKPVIQTNLIGHANQENQKVTVSVGDGVPDGAIVRLTDDKDKVLGEGQVNNGSAEVVIKDKMPANTKVKATTIVKNGGEITSDPSDPSNVSQDDVAPTLTVSAPSEITAGDDLTFTFDAKDNVKVNFEIATGIASGMFDMGNLMNILSTQQKTTYSSYQDDHMKGTTTLLSVPDSEVGKHEFTFKVTDDANHTVTKKVSVTVYPKLKLNVEPITVPLGGTLPDAKVALGNTEGIAEVKNKTTGKVDIPAPTIQWVEQPKTDKVGNALPGKVRITFNDNRNGGKPVDVSVPVNVQDQNAPEIKVYKKENGNYVEITAKDKDGYIKLDSYAREDVDFKITSTDNSGQINDLSMMPIPGVKSSKPDGTGSKDNPKSFTLTGQAPLGDKYSRVVKAVDPSGNTTTLKVRLYPHNQSEKYGNKVHGKLLTYKMSDGNNYPDPKDGISQEGNDFPAGSTYAWATEPKWTDPTSGKDGQGTPKEVSISVTLPDGSTKKVKSTLKIIDDVPPVIEEPENAETITKDNHTVYRVKVVRGSETKISLKLHDTSGQLQGVTATGNNFVTAGTLSKTTGATIDNPATVDLTVKAPNQAAEEGKPWQETVTLTDAKGNTTTATLELYADKDADLYNPTVKPVVKTNPTDTVTIDDIKQADTTTVKVTVEQPQSKSDVSSFIGQVEKEYGQATQENDVLGAIKQDAGPKVSSHIKGKHIVPGQTLPDGKHPGTQKVRVQLTFDDGSHKVVEVPVITKDPLNKQYEPVATELKKDYGQPATNEEIIKQVTVKKGQQVSEVVPNKDVTKIEVVPGQTAIDGKQPGTVKVQVKVTYKDGTSDIVNVHVTVADPASVTYPPKADALTVPWGTKQDDIKNQIVSKVTIDSKYPTDKTKPKIEVAKNANVPDGQTSTKVNVPVEVTYPDGSVAIVQVPVTVGNKQADNYDPTVTPIKKTYAERKITADDIKKAVTINGLDPNKGDYTISVDDTIPADGFAEVHTDVAVTIKYKDGSTEKTKVPVIIGQSEAGYTEKNLPQAKTIYKNYGEEIKDSEITGAVSVPNYTKSDKQTPGNANKLQFTIAEGSAKPDSHKSGKTLVKVVVTYEDGSKATVDVPVIVKAPDTEQYTPAATPVEKEFGKQTSEDDIKKAITISGYPEDKKNNIKYKVSTDKIPDGQKAGDFTVPVEITYADGSKRNIDVPVKVKSPQPQPQTTAVFVGTSPDAKNSISNKDQYPENTTFEWEKTPDTSKAGEPTSNILIHIPGQKDPLKAENVKVKVVAVPETQSINVFEGETPEASKGIKSKEGQTTTAEWQKDPAGVAQIPDTSTAGTVKGKVVVKVSGVQTPATVEVTVNVLPAPKGGTINTNVNGSVDPKSGVKGNDKYPNDTKFVWKDGNPDLTKPGIVTKKVTVTVPGMTAKAVEVTINVLPNPAGQDQVTLQGQTPDPKKSVADNEKYPKGTTFKWTKEPSTDNPGETTGKVEITVPGSDKPIPVDAKLKVIPYPTKQHRVVLQDPEGKTPLNAKDSIRNADKLPSDPNNATTFTWKDGKAPDNKVPGNKNGVVLVKIPGVDKEIEVPTTIEVVPNPNANDGIKVAKGGDPKQEDSIANIGDLPSGTTFKWKKDHKPNTENPAEKVPGVVEVTIPGIDHPIEVPVNVVVTDKPFINNGAATNDSGDKNKTEITGKSLPETKIEVQDENGNKIGEGVTDQEGKFQIAVTPKQAAGKQLKLIPTNNNQTGDATTVTVTEKPAKPTIDTPENGSVTIKPADNANNVSIDVDMVPNTVNEVIYENEPQPKQTIAAHKDKDGKWKLDGDVPTGVTIDPETGAITIPAEAVKDGSPISAIAKNKDGQSSDPAKGTVGFIKPQIINQSANNDDTKNKTIVTGKTLPGAVVKIVGPNGHEFTDSKTPVKADKDGNFTVEIPKQEQGTLLTITPINGPKAGTPVNVAVGISITDQKAKNTSDKPDKTVVSGETAPNAKVTITDTDGNPIKDKSGQPVSVTADDKGHFTVDIPKQADGTDIVLTPSLKNGDKPNLVGEPVNATVKDTPVVKDGKAINDPKTPDKTVVSGKTTPKAQVEVKDKDGKTIGTGTADDKGHFTVAVPKQDPDTKLTLIPTANGVTGESSEVTVKDDIVNNVKIKSSKSVDNTKASDTHIRSDKATAHELPQTGNNSFALTGLLLAGIAAMLGISGYRRKNKD